MANFTASRTGQIRPKLGVTPSAGPVMEGGAAEVAPGVTPARGAASGAGEKSLFLGAREEGGCLAGRRCFRVRGV